MKKNVILMIAVAVSLGVSYFAGWRHGYESNWHRNIQEGSPLKIGPYEKTDWRRVSLLKGGYEIWVDAGEVALAVTKDRKAVFISMDAYNKKVLDGVVPPDMSFMKSNGLYVFADKKNVSVEFK